MDEKELSTIIILDLFAFLFCGCNTAYHVYSTVSTPELTQKNEKKMDLYPSLDHVEGQFAWSPQQHLGLIFNNYLAFQPSTLGTIISEVGCGYYKAFNDSSIKKGKWYFDIYGGFGGGARKYFGSRQPGDISGSGDIINISSEYGNAFAQSSLYYKNNRLLFSFGLHGGWYYFTYFNAQYYYSHGAHYDGIIKKFEDQSMFDIAGAITLKYRLFKKHNLYLITQIAGRVTSMDSMKDIDIFNNSSFNPRPLTLNCGILVPFNKVKNQ